MSGHSKWSKIKRQKSGEDAKKGVLFGKLSKEITIAAKDGGDPNMNFKLRLAIERAKKFNMPKETIERAIKKGTGEIEGGNIEEIFYEAYGPSAIPFIIHVLTDNRNRTVSELKHIFSKNGGSFGASVLWMFNRLGVIRTKETSVENLKDKNKEDLELVIIDCGATDIDVDEDGMIIYTQPDQLQQVKECLEKNNFIIESAEIEYIPKDKGVIKNEDKEKIMKIIEALDDNEDVADFYTNIDL